MSDVTIHPHAGDRLVDIEARGGSRHERGAAIAAARRRQYPGTRLELVSMTYSETHGFLEASYARYRVVEA